MSCRNPTRHSRRALIHERPKECTTELTYRVGQSLVDALLFQHILKCLAKRLVAVIVMVAFYEDYPSVQLADRVVDAAGAVGGGAHQIHLLPLGPWRCLRVGEWMQPEP